MRPRGDAHGSLSQGVFTILIMDRYQTPNGRPDVSKPAPGKPALLRHLALVGGLDHIPPRTLRDLREGTDWQCREVDRLARLAGGLDALEALDAEPLPEVEPFDFTAIDADDLSAVHAVLAALHEHRPPYFDALNKILRSSMPFWLQDEYVTILHRLIARSARRGVAYWHRDPRRMAAAFAWLALGGNWAMGRRSAVSAQDIWRWYDVSDCRALARRVCVEAQLGSLYKANDEGRALRGLQVVFADAQLLDSSFRAYLVRSRDDMARSIVEDDRRRTSQRPIRSIGDGKFEVKARGAQPLWAYKGPSIGGRAVVMVSFGQSTDDDDCEIIGLSIPNARQLVTLVQDALDSPSLS